VALEEGFQVGAGELRDRGLGPEVGEETGEGLAVDGAGAGGQVRAGEEARRRGAEDQRGALGSGESLQARQRRQPLGDS
jgi:hypothetical protein